MSNINRPRRLFFDIETSGCIILAWGTGKQNISHEQIIEDSKIVCISYRWEDEKKATHLRWTKGQDDKQLLKKFVKIAEKSDALIAHNGKGFDVRHINARLAYHRLPPLQINLIEDTWLQLRRKLRLASMKLDYLATYFGIGKKLSTGGIRLWVDVNYYNDPVALDRMCSYCDKDVDLLYDVFFRLENYMDLNLNASAYNQDPSLCPKVGCGGKVTKYGTVQVSQLKRVQRVQCKKCGYVCRLGANLIKNTGNYPRV